MKKCILSCVLIFALAFVMVMPIVLTTNVTEVQAATCTHLYKRVRVVKPTCTTKGYTLYECVSCHKQEKQNYVNALGHHMTLKITDLKTPNGQKPAYPVRMMEKYCDRCHGCGSIWYEAYLNGKWKII